MFTAKRKNGIISLRIDMGDSLEKGTKSVTLLFCHHNLWRVSHDRNCLEFSLTSQNVIKFTIR